MKITVELDEIWMDGESSLTSEINHYVKTQVKQEIWKDIEDITRTTLTSVIKEEIEKDILKKGKRAVSKIIHKEKIKSPSSSIGVDGMCTLEEYIKYSLSNNTGWRSPIDEIKEIAKRWGDELKGRYDLLFASQLVTKMNETGLLRKDVAKRLIE